MKIPEQKIGISESPYRIILTPIWFLSIFLTISAYAQPDLDLLDYWEYYTDQKEMPYRYLTDVGLQQLQERSKMIQSLDSKEKWAARQAEVSERLRQLIGRFPPKTPLNAKITGRLTGDGFRVEKLHYESQPGLFVTAALFLPDPLRDKAPAILYCSGHTFDGYRSTTYQHAIINLVKKGFIVLAFDPVGQGERQQYLDETGTKSVYNTPTHEHSYVGGQCFISGSSLARHMIWDGIRSIDYLISRKEVDPDRIGITGRSGGGTQSVYIAAFDERVRAAAPENYVTSFTYLLQSIGPQDAEQNLPYFLKNHLDFADFLEVRAPKPTLIISTVNDFFSIEGARTTYLEVRKAYHMFGLPDNIQMCEDVAGHESTLRNREAMYAFFQEHLENPGNHEDEEVALFDKADLNVTSTGQVLTALGGETIYSLNRKEIIKIREQRSKVFSGQGPASDSLKTMVISLTGYEMPGATVDPVYSGRTTFGEHRVDKFLLSGRQGRKIPVLVMSPDAVRVTENILILSPEGKAAELQSGLPAQLASLGYRVILPDITGSGELKDKDPGGDSYISHSSYNKWYAGILTGKTITGLRMEDITSVCSFIRETYPDGAKALTGIARGLFTSDLLHGSTVLSDFSRLILIEPLLAQQRIVMNPQYDPYYIQSAVPGSLAHYDLPDLVAAYAPGRILMVNVTDQSGNVLTYDGEDPDFTCMSEAYRHHKVRENIEFQTTDAGSIPRLITDWLR